MLGLTFGHFMVFNIAEFVSIPFCHFPSAGIRGWIQTLAFRTISKVFYHSATGAQLITKLYLFLPLFYLYN